MNENTMTRGQRTNADVTALLRARHTLLWIVTREELRVERAIVDAASAAKYEARFWDCCTGITKPTGETVENVPDPRAAVDYVVANRSRCVYIMRDLHKWLDAVTLRALRNAAKSLQSGAANEQRSIVVLSPSSEIPPELAGHATVIEYPLPDRQEIATMLDDLIASVQPPETFTGTPEEFRARIAPNGTRERAIDAAVGLSAEEAANCYARSLVTSKRIDPELVSGEKRRVVARERVLTWTDPDPRGLDAVGGLDVLKGWLATRRAAFSAKARAFGLPAPKGMLLVGPPGTGKSLVAKCIASAWGLPLLRLDLGALKSKYVGESEGNIRRALQVAETVAPCVVWLDEIEKALAGSTGPQGDGGVSADALGAILSWMQERAGAVFVVATANDVSALPPELTRKGRFDELFYVDLPTDSERLAIVNASLRQYGRDVPAADLGGMVAATAGFTGAEIAACVPEALFVAFNEGERALTASDLMTAARTVVPVSKSAAEKLDALRKWAAGRARPASTPEVTGKAGRVLDLG